MATSLSSHSVKRLKERANVSSKREAKHKAVHARKCGYSPADFKGAFKDYLLSKCKQGKKIKVHCEFVYIFDGTRLVTSYEVPDKYKGKVDSYLVSEKLVKNNKMDNTSVVVPDVIVETPIVESKVNKAKETAVLRHSLRTQLLKGTDKLSICKTPLFANSIYGGYISPNMVEKNRDYLNNDSVICFAEYVLKKIAKSQNVTV